MGVNDGLRTGRGATSVLAYAHKLVGERVRSGDIVVDATIGNGVDTCELAKLVGPVGFVYGFDVQPAAIQRTTERLQAEAVPHETACCLICAGHERMSEFIEEKHRGRLAAVMFNLGYLPGGEHADVITTATTTIAALESSLAMLRLGGIVTIVLYPGHDGGDSEAEAIEAWASLLSGRDYDVISYRMLNRRSAPPYLLALVKKGESA
jgi:hypothetical protein